METGLSNVSKKGFEGLIFDTKKYGRVIVEQYSSCSDVLVRFINTGSRIKTHISSVRSGSLKDPFAPSLYGVGITDIVTVCNKEHTREYTYWRDMLSRCYDKKRTRNINCNCSISDSFKTLSNFKEWCEKQIGFGNEGWQLDKDILIKGNKVYSEDTCCFVPAEVNILFAKRYAKRGEYPIGVYKTKNSTTFKTSFSCNGVSTYLGSYMTVEDAFLAYKQAKERHIKEVANKWKDQIDPRVYDALMNYQVEITD